MILCNWTQPWLRCVNQICFSQIQSKELDEKVDIITAIVNGQQLAVEVITNICCPAEGQSYYISLDDSWPNSTCKKTLKKTNQVMFLQLF